MPLRDDLLNPIAGPDPAGPSLRYDRVYDQIKEARTEEDDSIPAGAWERQAKRADYNLAIKLAGETLATRSKDLQIAVWLGESLIKKEGIDLLPSILTLLLDLQKTFWDTLHPEIDEGDAGLRAVPLDWCANRYSRLVYEAPITRSGVSFYSYRTARALGTAASATTDAAQTARDAAIARGQATSEEVDAAIAVTPKSFYSGLHAMFQVAADSLEELSLYCENQYGDDGPSFRKLRDSVEEVNNVVNALLNEKRKTEPDVQDTPAPSAPEPVPGAVAAQVPASAPVPVSAPVIAPPVAAVATATIPAGRPQTWDQAEALVKACVPFMTETRPTSTVPYLLQTAVWWGALRREYPNPPAELLEPPAVSRRQALKAALNSSDWVTLFDTGMLALSEPCGRAWLDLHRYIYLGASGSGFPMIASSVLSSVRGLLTDFPEMPTWTLGDDTPVANADTLLWIEEMVMAGAAPGGFSSSFASDPAAAAHATALPPLIVSVQPSSGQDAEASEDTFAAAAALAAEGQLNGAVAMLIRDAAQQNSGRARFQRRVQVAELCLASGKTAVAIPLLRELAAEIELRSLEAWEPAESIARPVALLLRGLHEDRIEPEWTEQFARLCRLDPAAALEIST